MPYISQKDRWKIFFRDRQHGSESYSSPQTPGELNYCITLYITDYIRRKGLSYASLNEVVGVLECAKQELYRRMAAPYEDRKCAENGDIYD